MDPAVLYHTWKEWLVSNSGQSHALWHVHAGLAGYVLVQLALGTRRGSLPALAFVAQIELANELRDRSFYGEWRWGDTLGEIALTLLWPSVLVGLSHYRRRRFARKAEQLRAKADAAKALLQHQGRPDIA